MHNKYINEITMHTLLKGSKTSVLFRLADAQTGASIDYNLCSEILLRLYNTESNQIKIDFKLDNVTPANSTMEVVEVGGKSWLRFYLDTTSMTVGIYNAEAKAIYAGIQAPVIKEMQEFIEIKTSRT